MIHFDPEKITKSHHQYSDLSFLGTNPVTKKCVDIVERSMNTE
jgi:hypothetical protein